MSLIVTDNEIPRERPMLGLHDAICVFVEDIGTHICKTQWGDKAQHKVIIMWELDEMMKSGDYAGKPFIQSKQYTFTLFEKGNLSKDIESWFSRKITPEVRKNGFDLQILIGKKCQLNLIESDDGKYVNIGGVMPPSKSNELVQVCTVCPEWVTKKRMQSMEVTHKAQPGADPSEPPPEEEYSNNSLPF